MSKSAKKLSICGDLDSQQVMWLKSLGFVPDKSILDCNPLKQQITFEDGTVRQVTEVYVRVMGYHRPVNAFNPGKKAEYHDRKVFTEEKAMAALARPLPTSAPTLPTSPALPHHHLPTAVTAEKPAQTSLPLVQRIHLPLLGALASTPQAAPAVA